MGFRTTMREKVAHRAFKLTLTIKGLFAFFEVAAAVALYSVNRNFLTNLVLSTFHDEFQTDPHDLIANALLHAAQALSVGTQLFISLYLLASGLTKIVVIAGLLRGKLVYYPAAIGVFLIFVLYQLYQYSITPSIWLVLLTLLDLLVIWLTWREYRSMRERLSLATVSPRLQQGVTSLPRLVP